jgi:alpha-tubulin suppressor-like RCC1 family protein
VLAVDSDNKLYCWGSGINGALGFGDTVDVTKPKLLKINTGEFEHRVWKVACGKNHSMCLTIKRQVFSWGQGQYGKLGHGNEDD